MAIMWTYVNSGLTHESDSVQERYALATDIGTQGTNNIRALQYCSGFDTSVKLAMYMEGDEKRFMLMWNGKDFYNTGRVEFIADASGTYSVLDDIEQTATYNPMLNMSYMTFTTSFLSGLIEFETDLQPYDTLAQCRNALMDGTSPTPQPDPDDPSTYSGVVVKVVGVLVDEMDEGGTSNPEMPDGEFNPDTTPIDIPSLPPISAAESGLVSLFRPDLAQLQALGRYLWTNIADVPDNLKKLVSNPMDCLIALNIVPCIPDVGETRAVKLGFWETGAQMPPVLNQWYSYYCGGVKIPLYSGTYLDYSPNTKITLMLPFIGSVPLNTDEVMNRTIGVTYHIDLLSGQCVALVSVDNSVYYQFTGECAVSVPLTGADYSRIYSAAVGTLGALVTGGIGAVSLGRAAGAAISASDTAIKGAKAAADAGKAFASVNRSSKGIAGVAAIREGLVSAQSLALESGRAAAQAPTIAARGVKAAQIARTLDNAVSAVMGAKQMVSHSGSLSGAAGMLGVRTPFVTIEYPNQSLPENYKHFTGYPSNIFARLGTLSGYTECEQVLIENCPCTDDEMSQILEALKGGVYL